MVGGLRGLGYLGFDTTFTSLVRPCGENWQRTLIQIILQAIAFHLRFALYKSALDCSQNAEPISGISGISSLGLSHCKNSHLRENDEKHFYDAVKTAFDDYYSLDKFSPDAWR